MSRFHIGIDLGTTNCAISYVDTLNPDKGVQLLKISQWAEPGATTEDDTLPSFVMFPIKAEWQRGQLDLPWLAELGPSPLPFLIGKAARDQAVNQPERIIHSAKSWLTHDAIDQDSGFLPWQSQEITGDKRLTAVAVSALYLKYLRAMWDHTIGQGSQDVAFSQQQVTVTIPASFDEAAQRLTLQAVQEAGYPKGTRLLEEPLAAFHLYLHDHREVLNDFCPDKDAPQLLVVDIGGGTADFSLFAIARGSETLPHVRRLAVSHHLLLGGDNIDTKLASHCEAKLLLRDPLPTKSWGALLAEARKLKERVLAAAGATHEDTYRIAVNTGGRSLFGSTKTITINHAEVLALITETFYPECDGQSVGDGSLAPHSPEQGALGLKHPQEQAFTKHLAAFLNGRSVDGVLFAGGSLKPQRLRERLVTIIGSWQASPVRELPNRSFDLAIALGAALAPSQAHLIKGGYPRSIYIEVTNLDGASHLLCLVPKGFTGESALKISQWGLQLRLGQPVVFQLYTALDRDQDATGDILPAATKSMLHALPPVITDLSSGGNSKPKNTLIAVYLEAHMTATGVLDLHCVNTADHQERYVPTFSLKARSKVEAVPATAAVEASPSAASLQNQQPITQATAVISSYFGKGKTSVANSSKDQLPQKPKNLTATLEGILNQKREEWELATMRDLWPALEPGVTRRNRSLLHETAFLSLAGYILRPGFGYSQDPFRIDKLWRTYELGLHHSDDSRAQAQWWIMWRRVAGGLDKSRQEQLFRKIMPQIKNNQVQSAEAIMLAGALERVDANAKIQLGHKLVAQITAGAPLLDQRIWALARLASRLLLHASSAAVIPPDIVCRWGQDLDVIPLPGEKRFERLALFYACAGRLVNDRGTDLPREIRQHFYQRHAACEAPEWARRPLVAYQEPDLASQSEQFGEDLPLGLVYAASSASPPT